jgi:hypothetical protein
VFAVHDNPFNGRTAKRRADSTLEPVAAVSTQSASSVARSTSTHCADSLKPEVKLGERLLHWV